MFRIKSKEDYVQQYQAAKVNVEKFWDEIAQEYFWFEKYDEVENCDLKKAQIEWFKNGKTNITYNCLDRHLERFGDKVAVIWEGNDVQERNIKITYKELHEKVCQFSNFLVARAIKKGDRVCIYMPMIVEGLVAMLACARIGAIHSVVFAGFSANALHGRMVDCGAKMLITADLVFRGDKKIDLLAIVDEAVRGCDFIESVVVYERNGDDMSVTDGVTNSVQQRGVVIWQDEVVKYPTTHQAVEVDANDTSFILYTSGSTGKPKGIMHGVGGYMVYVGYSFANVFQYEKNEVFFCSADIGWITGHSYLTYGPLLNGATILMFEGVPTYPTASRFWQVIEKHKVNIFYTAPTAIRALMQKGDEFVKGYDLSSLRVLGTVGEPINEEAWQWYYDNVGGRKCPIVDTWWQTETGGIMISSLAGITKSKAAHAGLPLPGVVPTLFDEEGKEILESDKIGNLCMKQSWPGMARGIWNDEKKFFETYYKRFTGHYFAGDGAFRDADGLYRIIGRVDDVINVSGHRLGTAEIENAINSHELVSESAVIGYPHQIKGEGICAFVILSSVSGVRSSDTFVSKDDKVKLLSKDDKVASGVRFSTSLTSRMTDNVVSGCDEIKQEIIALVVKEIGAIAKPDRIYLVSDLPKTRSGKIMRRILKKIVNGDGDFGDVSTLLNPQIVEQIKLMITNN